MRLAAGVEYCGAGYDGWQRQAGHDTVQEKLESALSRVADEPVVTLCAGRTDAGVHAIQQVVHFDTDADRENHSWVFGTNSNLPEDICLNWVCPVSEDFHARFSALSRHYRYYILNRPVRTALFRDRITWEIQHLDIQRMKAAARALTGKHDFTSYRATSCQAKSPVRHIYQLEIQRYKDIITIEVAANAFLHHMVRNMAGVLIMIGSNKYPPEWAREVLEARDRTLAGFTAPAAGLYLIDVNYPADFDIPSATAGADDLDCILKSRFGDIRAS